MGFGTLITLTPASSARCSLAIASHHSRWTSSDEIHCTYVSSSISSVSSSTSSLFLFLPCSVSAWSLSCLVCIFLLEQSWTRFQSLSNLPNRTRIKELLLKAVTLILLGSCPRPAWTTARVSIMRSRRWSTGTVYVSYTYRYKALEAGTMWEYIQCHEERIAWGST